MAARIMQTAFRKKKTSKLSQLSGLIIPSLVIFGKSIPPHQPLHVHVEKCWQDYEIRAATIQLLFDFCFPQVRQSQVVCGLDLVEKVMLPPSLPLGVAANQQQTHPSSPQSRQVPRPRQQVDFLGGEFVLVHNWIRSQ